MSTLHIYAKWNGAPPRRSGWHGMCELAHALLACLAACACVGARSFSALLALRVDREIQQVY